jgi:enoyl-CoA hydratase
MNASVQLQVTTDRDRHVLLVGINRPETRNAFNFRFIEQLSAAYEQIPVQLG